MATVGTTDMPQRRGALPLAWVLLPLLVTGYQIASKRIADDARGGDWLASILTHPVLPVLVALEIASFATWMYVLARMQLSEAFPLSAVSYVFVLLASWVLFGESGSVLQVVGSVAILVGVWLIGRGSGRAG